MTGDITVEELVEHFSESVGVEKATEMVLEAARDIGLDDPERFDRQQVIDICEIIQEVYGGYVAMIAHDLEVRKQAERRFHALFEHIPDAAYIVEFDGLDPIVRTVNGAFEDVFGYDEATIVGESANDYLVPPEEQDAAQRLDREAMTGSRIETEVRRQTAAGERRDFLFRGVTVTTATGTAEGYGIYTDITNRKERERELERQNEQLDRFASVVSHDLRNPLNVAAGHLELARETGDLSHLDTVAAAHGRMERLIDSLLTLARQGQTVGDREPVDLDTLLDRAWSAVAVPTASLAVEQPLGTVMADPGRLVQLFENLLRNAIEHVGEDVSITVGRLDDDADRPAAGRGFYVEDDGPGIPSAERDSVLQSGYTTSEDGTGLGLAIAQSVTEAHGWTFRVTGRDGARFEVSDVAFVEG